MSSDYYGGIAGEVADRGARHRPETGQCAYCERLDCILCPLCGECDDCCEHNADCGGWA